MRQVLDVKVELSCKQLNTRSWGLGEIIYLKIEMKDIRLYGMHS